MLKTLFSPISFLWLALILVPSQAFSQNQFASGTFNYEGRLLDNSGNPRNDSNIDIQLEILTDDQTCALYVETHTVDIDGEGDPDKEGFFSVRVGSGVVDYNPLGSMKSVFTNDITHTQADMGDGTIDAQQDVHCSPADSGNISVSSSDQRWLRVTVNDGTPEVLSPDIAITGVPAALTADHASNSEELGGKTKDEFIQVGGSTTQAVVDALADGSSTLYMPSGALTSATDVFASDQMAVGTTTPGAGVELEIQDDTPTIRLEATDAGTGNMSIEFMDTAGTNQAQIMSVEGTNSLIIRTDGDTALEIDDAQKANFQGEIDVTGNAQFQASMTVAGTIQGGVYDNAAESGTLQPALAACGPACAGTQWMNSDLNLIRYWDGAAIRSVGSFSGTEVANQVLTSNGPGNAPTWQNPTAAPIGNAGGDLDGTYPNPTIKNDAVTSSMILDETVDTADLANTSVTLAKLADEGAALESIRRNTSDDGFEYFSAVDRAGDSMSGDLTLQGQKELRFSDDDDSHYISLKAPPLASQIDLTLPDSSGGANQFLQTDGSGNLTWATPVDTDNDTTYTADGDGISLSGTTFSLELDGSTLSKSATGLKVEEGNLTISNLSGYDTNENIDHTSVDVTAGDGLTGGGDISATRTLNVVGGNGITANTDDIAVDLDADPGLEFNSGALRVKTGAGLSRNSTGIFHTDTSAVADSDNSNGVVLQDITFDTFGHVQTVGTADLDSRYYTETESDSNFVDAAGDSMTGALSIAGSADAVQLSAQAQAAQTANLFELKNSAGTPIFTVQADGTISATTDIITKSYFDANIPATGETNTAANVGTGVGLFKDKSGPTINLKSIHAEAGGEITITNNADDITLDVNEGNLDHGSIGGLLDDDHTQYALLAGRGTGQSLIGGTSANGTLSIDSTSDVSKGLVSINPGGGTVKIGGSTNGDGSFLDYRPNGNECNDDGIMKWDATNNRWVCGTDQGSISSGSGSTNRIPKIVNGVLMSLGNSSLSDDGTEVSIAGTVDFNVDANSLFVDSDQNSVGIGTASPGAKLTVEGSADQVQLSAQAFGGQTANLLELKNSAGTAIYTVRADGAISAATDIADKKYVDDEIAGLTDNDTTYTADGEGIEVASEEFSLELDGTTLSKGASGLKVNAIGSAEITNNTIDFAELADSMTLDASTTISATGTNTLTIENGGTGHSFRVNDVSGDTSPFLIDVDGNVMIGAASGSSKLSVTGGATNASTAIFDGGSNDTVPLVVKGAGTATKLLIKNDRATGTSNVSILGLEQMTTAQSRSQFEIQSKWSDNNDGLHNSQTDFFTASGGTLSSTMTLLNGNVGIGENNPTSPVHLTAANPVIRLEDADASEFSTISGNNGNLRLRADQGNDVTNSSIDFEVDGSLAAKIYAGGGMNLAPRAAPTTPGAGDFFFDSGDGNKLKFHDGGSIQTVNTGPSGATEIDGLSDGHVVGSESLFLGQATVANTGNGNTGVGFDALKTNTGGNNNTAVGRKALEVSTGSNNSAFGFDALLSQTGGSQNTALGAGAGSGITTGNDNTLIGFQAGDSIVTGNKNIVIGNDVDLAAAASQSMTIGNIIFATGVDGTGTTVSSGNVGIGTASPNAKLTVEGVMTLDQQSSDPTGTAGYGSLYTKTDGGLYYRDGTGTITDLLFDDNTTYTADGEGIEVTTEEFSIELDGTTLSKGASGLKVNSIGSNEISNGSITNTDISGTAAIARSKLAAGTTNRALVTNGSGVITESSTTASEIGFLSGVTSGVQAQLDGKQASLGYIPLDSGGDTMTGALDMGAGNAMLSTANVVGTPAFTFQNDTNTGIFSPAADEIAIGTAGSEALRVDEGGRVGIGLTNPLYPFHLKSVRTNTSGTSINSRFESVINPGSTSTANVKSLVGSLDLTPAAGISIDGQGIAIDGSIVHNGAGTSSDVTGVFGSVLNIGSGDVTDAVAFEAEGSNFGTGAITNFTGFRFHESSVSFRPDSTIGIEVDIDETAGNFAFRSTGTAKSYFEGNLGVGTDAPTEKLDVAGSARIGGALDYEFQRPSVNAIAAAPGVIHGISTPFNHNGRQLHIVRNTSGREIFRCIQAGVPRQILELFRRDDEPGTADMLVVHNHGCLAGTKIRIDTFNTNLGPYEGVYAKFIYLTTSEGVPEDAWYMLTYN